MNKSVRYCNIFFWFLYYISRLYYRNCVLQKDQEKNGYHQLKMYEWILKVYVDLCRHELAKKFFK